MAYKLTIKGIRQLDGISGYLTEDMELENYPNAEGIIAMIEARILECRKTRKADLEATARHIFFDFESHPLQAGLWPTSEIAEAMQKLWANVRTKEALSENRHYIRNWNLETPIIDRGE